MSRSTSPQNTSGNLDEATRNRMDSEGRGTKSVISDQPNNKYKFPSLFNKKEGDDPIFEQEIKDVLSNIESVVSKELEEGETQYELGRIAILLSNLKDCSDKDRVKYLSLAVSALKSDKPNRVFANQITRNVEFSILKTQRGMFRGVYRIAGSTPLSATLSGVIISGLSMFFVVALISTVFYLFKESMNNTAAELGIKWFSLFVMTIMAAAGAFVSVISRLSHISSTRDHDPFLLFATGFFKPWIGIAVSIFLFFAIQSGLLNINGLISEPNARINILYVLAFISGFSERLVSDFITKTEGRLLGSASSASPSDGPQGRGAPDKPGPRSEGAPH